MPDKTAPITLVIESTAEEVTLVIEALNADAARRQRAATKAAAELEAAVADGSIPDRRSHSVRITKVLADAAKLSSFGERLVYAYKAPPTEGPIQTEKDLVEAAKAELEGLKNGSGASSERAKAARKVVTDAAAKARARVEADEVSSVPQGDDVTPLDPDEEDGEVDAIAVSGDETVTEEDVKALEATTEETEKDA